MTNFLPIIQKAAVFAGIDKAELLPMLDCLTAKEESYPKGAYLLRTGNTVSEIGLLLEGRVLIVQEDFWGNRNLIAQIMPGQIFAESFACSSGSVLNVSVVADAACLVLWLNIKRLITLCPKTCLHHQHVVHNLLAELADKNLRFNEKLTHMGQRTTRQKLLSYLSAEAQRHGASEFDIPFARQQLADYLSIERSAMSAELGRLRDAGILEFHKNHFILHLIHPEDGLPS